MNMLKKELIYIDVKADSKKELLSKLSDELYKQDYVKENFKEAILNREEKYPTGLPTSGVKVALPHAKSEYVNKSAILVATLEQPVSFKEMGSGTEDIDVELVFMLAVKDPSQQVKVLQKLINFFSKEDMMISLKESKEVNYIYNLLIDNVIK
ncbi:PTS sugar transporter subunit IIA [Anaerosalibacter massiliensis]|uniref:PTS sugar transporter subunit IIA n=1 Tax=Anaerosalibacter massiliensis TaxID=1347392 RepID=A0A9X2MMA2_9FIRM|nr:PTS sugar transporter subunit IIA [Anaerosalibacter massiliensis]MCR2045655.1 PTS sugar transporter subunit IIA [Anaerosalibacter massiliensis]